MRSIIKPIMLLILAFSILITMTAVGLVHDEYFSDENPRNFSQGVEDFGLGIFKNLVSEIGGSSNNNNSLFLSPYGLWSILTLAYLGSGGRTRSQLERALGISDKTEMITIANWNALKFMLRENSKNSSSGAIIFKSINRAYFSDRLNLSEEEGYLSDVQRRVDFTNVEMAESIINRDINITTEGKITNFVQSLDPTTLFVLINAVYFKGSWKFPFHPVETRPREFFVLPGKSTGTTTVQMMVQTNTFNHVKSDALGASMVELPYSNSNISMFLVLPTDTFDVDVTAQKLTRETFQDAFSQMTEKRIKIGMPRFKLSTRVEKELKSSLANLGITDLFLPGVADLTQFTNTTIRINADTIIHKAIVEVTEEGTIAAAASAVISTRSAAEQSVVVQFYCNRPFLFLIVDKITGITLFVGKLVHPKDIL